MAKLTLGRMVRTALAVTAVVGAQMAMAGPSTKLAVGDTIKLNNGVGDNPGGAFIGTVLTSSVVNEANNTFQSFCVEYNEHFYYDTPYFVGGISGHTENAVGAYGTYVGSELGHTSTQDPISLQTSWLFNEFHINALSDSRWYDHNVQVDQATRNTALQQAIWSFEDESFGALSGLALSYKALADAAVTSTTNPWISRGNVSVLNLYTTDRKSVV